jgi:NADPH2:quinone reductase
MTDAGGTTRAMRLYETGPPEVLTWQTVPLSAPGPGEVLLRHTAIGVNFGETLRRRGRNPLKLPSGMGHEAVGVVEAMGPGVRGLKPGTRVGYTGRGMVEDAYCERRVAPAAKLIRLPDTLAERDAASVLVAGICAQYLCRQTFRVAAGDTILVHAAAGGVGSVLCQWASSLGATVIGIVGSEAKRRAAKRNGCRHVLVAPDGRFADAVRDLTKGEGVDCVYDSVGVVTWADSLASAKRRGTVVSFGGASGDVRDFDLFATGPLGSPRIVRAVMASYTVTDAELKRRARELFRAIEAGMVRPRIGRTYALKDAAKAHRDIESRRSTGVTILLP